MPAHTKGSVFPVFGCTLGGPDEAGDGLLNCAIHAGMGRQTEVHCIGDGAPWIADQIDRVFGSQAHFMIDYYQYFGHFLIVMNPFFQTHGRKRSDFFKLSPEAESVKKEKAIFYKDSESPKFVGCLQRYNINYLNKKEKYAIQKTVRTIAVNIRFQ